MKPPNIIFIICDDLNDAIGGHGRIPSAPTPNLDRLRAMGVTFANAAANSPICMPSRNSALSGLHPRTTGHYRLNDPIHTNELLLQSTLLPGYLRAHGYATFGAGKVFHSGDKPNPRFPLKDLQWDAFEGGANYGPFPYDPSGERPIQRLVIHPNQAWLLGDKGLPELMAKFNDPFWMFDNDGMRFAFENGFAPLEDVPPGGWVRDPDGTPFHFESSEDRDLLQDERSTRFALDVLARDHDEQPFFLALGYIRPHTPLYVPREYFDRFPPESLELPPVKDDELGEVAAAHAGHRPYGRLRWEMLQPGGEPLWREWLQAYLASIAFIDDQLGDVLDALEKSPYADNTVVVFTSDNGFHMGDKDSLFKDTLWEGGSRVPLIVAAPGAAQGATCTAPVSLVDLYPTLLDLADLPSDPHRATHGHPLDGHSLAPFLEDPVNGHWDGPDIAVLAVRGLTGVHTAARSATHRYILCENGEEELYDHRVDPLEHRNLAADPARADIKAELRAALQSELARFDARSAPIEPQP